MTNAPETPKDALRTLKDGAVDVKAEGGGLTENALETVEGYQTYVLPRLAGMARQVALRLPGLSKDDLREIDAVGKTLEAKSTLTPTQCELALFKLETIGKKKFVEAVPESRHSRMEPVPREDDFLSKSPAVLRLSELGSAAISLREVNAANSVVELQTAKMLCKAALRESERFVESARVEVPVNNTA